MKIEILYLIGCSWYIKTKKTVSEVVKELKLNVKIEHILIDTRKKAKKYHFQGSPTIRINGRDIQNIIKKRTFAL